MDDIKSTDFSDKSSGVEGQNISDPPSSQPPKSYGLLSENSLSSSSDSGLWKDLNVSIQESEAQKIKKSQVISKNSAAKSAKVQPTPPSQTPNKEVRKEIGSATFGKSEFKPEDSAIIPEEEIAKSAAKTQTTPLPTTAGYSLSHSQSKKQPKNIEEDDRTLSLQELQEIQNSKKDVIESKTLPKTQSIKTHSDNENTLAVEGFAALKQGSTQAINRKDTGKVQVGQGFYGPKFVGNVYTSPEASLAQAESLKIAQGRILELEKLIDRLRYENEELASAGEVVRNRLGELTAKNNSLEADKKELKENYQSEILILKGNLQFKNDEVARFQLRIDELEMRLKSDFKKIRVRERELENRLELVKAEKVALLRAKDENILELKKKMEHLHSELENYKEKCSELNKAMGENQDSLKRTARALRLALASLGITEEEILGLKKAE